MKIFRIKYEMSNGNTLSAGIMAKTKEKATAYLQWKVPSLTRIVGIDTGSDVHALDTEVEDMIVNGSDKVKKYQNKIKELNKHIQAVEQDVEYYQQQLDSKNQQPSVSSKDIKEALKEQKQDAEKVYLCPYCDYEGSKQGVKMHISKVHTKSKNENENETESD